MRLWQGEKLPLPLLHSSQRQTPVDNWQLQQLMTTTTSTAAATATATRQRQATGNRQQHTNVAWRQANANEACAPRRRHRQKGAASHNAARCAGAQREFQCQERKLPRPTKRRQLVICANCQNNVVKHKRTPRLPHPHCTPLSTPLCTPLCTAHCTAHCTSPYFPLTTPLYTPICIPALLLVLHSVHLPALFPVLFPVLLLVPLSVFLFILLHGILPALLPVFFPVLLL